MAGKNQKRSLMWHKIIWNSNLGTQLYSANDSFWTTTAEYSGDRDGRASATSSIYYMALSIKSVPARTGYFEYKPWASSMAQTCTYRADSKLFPLGKAEAKPSLGFLMPVKCTDGTHFHEVAKCFFFFFLYNIYTRESSRWSLLKGQRSY